MAAERATNAEIERLLRQQSRETRRLVRALRGLILGIAPKAAEEARRDGLVYHDGTGPVRGSICQVRLTHEGVVLAFPHGAFLHDPDHLLTRGLANKAMRHMTVRSADLTTNRLSSLIRRAVLFDTTTTAQE